MIYTVTFNPSIDYIVSVDNFKLGEVNRTTEEYILPGGKGINVSIVLKNLEVDSIALGYISGFTGKEIKNRVEKQFNLKTDFIDDCLGCSRINFKMKSNEESEVNGNGPLITEVNIMQLMYKLSILKDGDFLILSGSVPSYIKRTIYSDIMFNLSQKNIKVVVDATGDLLMNVLHNKPFLIKPNNHELEEMFHVKLLGLSDVAKYARKLQEMGAKNVLISMAGDGAIFVCENGKTYLSEAPKGKVINSVGAGDSMIAGFIAGYIKTHNYLEAFRTGVATGSASAFSQNLATKEEVISLLKDIQEVEYEY